MITRKQAFKVGKKIGERQDPSGILLKNKLNICSKMLKLYF
jgi:hypothetical protein